MSRHYVQLLIIIIANSMVIDLSGQTNYNEELVPKYQLPEILNSSSGKITSVKQWELQRRAELLAVFSEQMFGRVPSQPINLDFKLDKENQAALNGIAKLKEVTMNFSSGHGTTSASLLILTPESANKPVPLFLGMNFCGNHTIHLEPSISITQSWMREPCAPNKNHSADESTRGKSVSRWPIEMILQRGYGLAVIYYGDLDPDFDDGFNNGIHALYHPSQPQTGEWGSIATWAWGLSRAMDYLENDPTIDQNKIAVIGHSRLGKTALWAGATDERFSLVISNDSGCGGAALSKRAFGETVQVINTQFPHWFCDNFNQFNGREVDLSFDQHMLLALMAPRPLYVASATEDQWADPKGEYLSLAYASEVYALYGNQSLDPESFPQPNQPVFKNRLAYHLRSGKHDLTKYDWEQYLSFADLHFK